MDFNALNYRIEYESSMLISECVLILYNKSPYMKLFKITGLAKIRSFHNYADSELKPRIVRGKCSPQMIMCRLWQGHIFN
jgi:hypothetical protein